MSLQDGVKLIVNDTTYQFRGTLTVVSADNPDWWIPYLMVLASSWQEPHTPSGRNLDKMRSCILHENETRFWPIAWQVSCQEIDQVLANCLGKFLANHLAIIFTKTIPW